MASIEIVFIVKIIWKYILLGQLKKISTVVVSHEVLCAMMQLVMTALKWNVPKWYMTSLTSYMDCVMHVMASGNTGADRLTCVVYINSLQN